MSKPPTRLRRHLPGAALAIILGLALMHGLGLLLDAPADHRDLHTMAAEQMVHHQTPHPDQLSSAPPPRPGGEHSGHNLTHLCLAVLGVVLLLQLATAVLIRTTQRGPARPSRPLMVTEARGPPLPPDRLLLCVSRT